MGWTRDNKKPPPGVYQDHPDRDDAASISSAVALRDHVDFEDTHDSDAPELPPYAEIPTLPTQLPIAADALHNSGTVQPSTLDAKIEESIGCTDRKGTVLTRLSPTLTTDPVALKAYLKWQAQVRPTPLVHITGTHTETRREGNGKKAHHVTDFDFWIDATETITNETLDSMGRPENCCLYLVNNSVKSFRGSLTRIKNKNFRADVEATRESPTLDEWCHLFCASTSTLKSFTLTRRITDRNEALLKERLESAVRCTNYRGRVGIDFPLNPRKVTIQTPHTLNRLRVNFWVRFACYILQLWILTWPVLWLMTKRWEVIEVHWGHGSIYAPTGKFQSGTGEEEWVNKWRFTVMNAAERRIQGLQPVAFVEGDGGFAERRNSSRDVGPVENRGGFVGAMTGLVRGVSGVLRENELARGWGGDN